MSSMSIISDTAHLRGLISDNIFDVDSMAFLAHKHDILLKISLIIGIIACQYDNNSIS